MGYVLLVVAWKGGDYTRPEHSQGPKPCLLQEQQTERDTRGDGEEADGQVSGQRQTADEAARPNLNIMLERKARAMAVTV